MITEWQDYLDLPREMLLQSLAAAAQNIANFQKQIGFLKAEELRHKTKFPEKLELEGELAAATELRWFLIKVLDNAPEEY